MRPSVCSVYSVAVGFGFIRVDSRATRMAVFRRPKILVELPVFGPTLVDGQVPCMGRRVNSARTGR